MNPVIMAALASLAADGILVAGSLLLFAVGLLGQRLLRKAIK